MHFFAKIEQDYDCSTKIQIDKTFWRVTETEGLRVTGSFSQFDAHQRIAVEENNSSCVVRHERSILSPPRRSFISHETTFSILKGGTLKDRP